MLDYDLHLFSHDAVDSVLDFHFDFDSNRELFKRPFYLLQVFLILKTRVEWLGAHGWGSGHPRAAVLKQAGRFGHYLERVDGEVIN